MQSRSHPLHFAGNATASARRTHIPIHAAIAFSTIMEDGPQLLSGKTRYRNPALNGLVSVDPVRVLIVSKFHECVAIAALVHSIGRFATRMAYSAESALALAGEFVPDVVLLTTDLPDHASYHVAAALRWRSSLSVPRLIAITSDIVTNDRDRALAAGFEQYLTVPVERDALESVLRRRATRLPPVSRGSHNASN